MEGALKESQQIVRFTLRYYQIFIDYLSITVCRGRRLFVLYISIIPMINPIDRTTKKISIWDNSVYDIPHTSRLFEQSVLIKKPPIAPNKYRILERIRQHMSGIRTGYEGSFIIYPNPLIE